MDGFKGVLRSVSDRNCKYICNKQMCLINFNKKNLLAAKICEQVQKTPKKEIVVQRLVQKLS